MGVDVMDRCTGRSVRLGLVPIQTKPRRGAVGVEGQHQAAVLHLRDEHVAPAADRRADRQPALERQVVLPPDAPAGRIERRDAGRVPDDQQPHAGGGDHHRRRVARFRIRVEPAPRLGARRLVERHDHGSGSPPSSVIRCSPSTSGECAMR